MDKLITIKFKDKTYVQWMALTSEQQEEVRCFELKRLPEGPEQNFYFVAPDGSIYILGESNV